MRSYLEIEHDRLAARLPSAILEKTVHRSSLLVPELPGYRSVISFLNHFLLKRGIPKVSCKITAVDPSGARAGTKTLFVNEPRAYFIDLTAMFSPKAVNSYIVEFFSTDNLAIPFPAVMINHFGDGTLNMVHAYNRVVNDVFEQDADVAIEPAESSIDVKVDKDTDTFSVFSAGPQPFRGVVTFELDTENGRRVGAMELDIPRLTQKSVGLREVMPDMEDGTTGILRIYTPSQFLFFGRMLAGQRAISGAFSANHTYYDCSTTAPEYYKNSATSWIMHSFVPKLQNIATIYPFFSKGLLEFDVVLHDQQGAEVYRLGIGRLGAPSSEFLSVNINKLLAKEQVEPDSIASFRLEATPVGGNTPTRIPHQLSHSGGGLASSVVYGLYNPNGIEPSRGFIWGQLIAGRGYTSTLGIVRAPNADRNEMPKLEIYGEAGLVQARDLSLPPGSGRALELGDLVPRPELFDAGEPTCLWYVISGKKRDFFAHSIVTDRMGNCTAEHSF